MKLFVSGSLAYDRIMDFPEKFSDHILPEKIHILNVCFMVNGINEQFGGTAGNIAYNLKLLGEHPLILSCAGKDFDSYASWLQDLGLSMDGIRLVEGEFTAGAYITTDKADNQITGFHPGAMRYTCDYKVDGCDPTDTLAIVSPGNLDDMIAYSRCYKERRIPYILDPGQSIPALSAKSLVEMLAGSKLFISNDYELEMVMRSTGKNKTDLLDLTDAIITTLGDRGSLVLQREGEVQVAAAPTLRVLDPTGAGDAFRAGLIKGLVIGKDLVDACHMGAACASFSVECQGTQCHRFSMEEFWARYNSMFNEE
jgi:adenosine kinase